MIIELKSVASVVDDQTFIVYPMYNNGGYDKDGGMEIDKCSMNWLPFMDEWEREVVKQLIDIKKNRKFY